MNAQSLYFRCRYLHSILLVVATGFAILQPRCTEAQLTEAPMPRAVLKASRTPDTKNRLEFRFSPDGKLLATWSESSSGGPRPFKLWDVSTAEERMCIVEGIWGVGFSPDTKVLLIWNGSAVSVRDISTGHNLATLEHNGVFDAQYIRNGELLVTFAHTESLSSLTTIVLDTQIKFWNTTTWEETQTGIDTRQTFMAGPQFSGDGQTVVGIPAGDRIGSALRIWNIDSGRAEPTPDVPCALGLFGFYRLTPDTQTLAIPVDFSVETSARDLSELRIVYWDLAAGKEKTARNFLWPKFASPDITSTRDNPTTVSVELNGDIFVVRDWKTEEVIHEFPNPTSWKSTPLNSFPMHTGCHLAGNQLLMLYTEAEAEGEINLWSLDTQQLKGTIKTAAPIAEMALASDGKTLAVRMDAEWLGLDQPRCRVAIWDLETRKEIFGFDYANLIKSIALSPDGKLLAIAELEQVHLREVATGNLWDTLNSDTVSSLRFSHDGRFLAVGTWDNIELWPVAKRRKVWKSSAASGIDCMVFSPDGKSLAVGSGSRTGSNRFSLIDASDGTLLFGSKHDKFVNFIHFSPDGKTLSLVRTDGNLSRFDMASRKENTMDHVGGREVSFELWSSRFALADSTNTLAAARFVDTYSDREGEVSLCNATTGEQTAILTAPTGDIKCVLMTPDGHMVVGGGAARKKHQLEIVDLKTGTLVGKITGVKFESKSPDGEILVTQDMKTADLVLWKTRGGIELARFPRSSTLRFSPDSTVLAMSGDGVIELWNVADFLKGE